MFTGLVEDVGEVSGLRSRGGVREILVRTALPPADLRAGDSVSVHGVCLTLMADCDPEGSFRVAAVSETLRRSTLDKLRPGSRVHLERALKLEDRLGGHLVQGHVDGLGSVRRIERRGEEWVLDVGLPQRLRRYLVEKGSICLDGVSLTVARTGPDWFRVHIVPATAGSTLIARYRPGREVNLEVDLIAKYVESLLGAHGPLSEVD
jgi:riboflavin synthase